MNEVVGEVEVGVGVVVVVVVVAHADSEVGYVGSFDLLLTLELVQLAAGMVLAPGTVQFEALEIVWVPDPR